MKRLLNVFPGNYLGRGAPAPPDFRIFKPAECTMPPPRRTLNRKGCHRLRGTGTPVCPAAPFLAMIKWIARCLRWNGGKEHRGNARYETSEQAASILAIVPA